MGVEEGNPYNGSLPSPRAPRPAESGRGVVLLTSIRRAGTQAFPTGPGMRVWRRRKGGASCSRHESRDAWRRVSVRKPQRCGEWLPVRGGAGDGVRGGSPAGLGSSPTRGSLERAKGKERRCLCRTGELRSQPGAVEVSHRHSQRRHFAQAGESECLPAGGAKRLRPITWGVPVSWG